MYTVFNQNSAPSQSSSGSRPRGRVLRSYVHLNTITRDKGHVCMCVYICTILEHSKQKQMQRSIGQRISHRHFLSKQCIYLNCLIFQPFFHCVESVIMSTEIVLIREASNHSCHDLSCLLTKLMSKHTETTRCQ
jgi:hypothetical protein